MIDPVKNMKWALYPLGDVTQWYGENEALYTKAFKVPYADYYKQAGGFVHSGIDIVRPHEEHIFTVCDGIVSKIVDDTDGYGNHIEITSNHDGYNLEWVYGHLDRMFVTKGQFVKAGQFIGTMGNTGFVVSNSTGNGFWNANPYAGTHLHLGVRKKVASIVQDYYNKAFGRFDPLPLFLDPKLLSTKILKIASYKQDKTLFNFSSILKQIGL